VLADLLKGGREQTLVSTIEATATLRMKEAGPLLASLASDNKAPGNARAEAIKALSELKDARLADVVKHGLADDNEAVRKEAVRQLARLGPDEAAEQLSSVLDKGSLGEKQNVLAILGDLRGATADKLIGEWLGKLSAGAAPRELHLEIIEAAAKRKTDAIKTALAKYEAARPADNLTAKYRETLYGGDAASGKKVFLEKVEAQCLRCHKLEGSGGDVGPVMDGIGKKYDREFLLQSIVDPSAKIAEGFENLTITLKGGGALIGIFKGETDKELTIFSQEDGLIKIPKADIASRATGLSGMLPGLGEVMSRRELRDLIEFMANLK
jgi:quinoprotein glucose dehydrogenase